MEIDAKAGLIKKIPFFNSPNQDERAAPNDINLLVIHCISVPDKQFVPATENFETSLIHDLFMGHHSPALKDYFDGLKHEFPKGIPEVSAHVVIRREKDEIFQYVPFTKRAWHAGRSQFEDRERCNDFSIGIELEGYSEDIPYTEMQYKRLAELTAAILHAYPNITLDRIVAHSAIAIPAGRKPDPGILFDWNLYFQCIQEIKM